MAPAWNIDYYINNINDNNNNIKLIILILITLPKCCVLCEY